MKRRERGGGAGEDLLYYHGDWSSHFQNLTSTTLHPEEETRKNSRRSPRGCRRTVPRTPKLTVAVPPVEETLSLTAANTPPAEPRSRAEHRPLRTASLPGERGCRRRRRSSRCPGTFQRSLCLSPPSSSSGQLRPPQPGDRQLLPAGPGPSRRRGRGAWPELEPVGPGGGGCCPGAAPLPGGHRALRPATKAKGLGAGRRSRRQLFEGEGWTRRGGGGGRKKKKNQNPPKTNQKNTPKKTYHCCSKSQSLKKSNRSITMWWGDSEKWCPLPAPRRAEPRRGEPSRAEPSRRG